MRRGPRNRRQPLKRLSRQAKGKSRRKIRCQVSKRGHRPQRSCLGCGQRDDQGKLIRLVVADRVSLKVDRQGTGRGGYLHVAEECWKAFVRRKSLHRAFRTAINKDAREKLIQELKQRYLE